MASLIFSKLNFFSVPEYRIKSIQLFFSEPSIADGFRVAIYDRRRRNHGWILLFDRLINDVYILINHE
jgi:hypothetical protein